MATATFIITPDIPSTDDQGFAASQGPDLVETPDIPFTAHVGPGWAFKMRAWDTVAGENVYWMSYGDTNTKPPTLNPVINVTATRVSLQRTA
jgi:hypothetical protein